MSIFESYRAVGVGVVVACCGAIVLASGECFVPRTPGGCGDCGDGFMTYCDNGCQGGEPGTAGPGVPKDYYCYTLGQGESSTHGCTDPLPSGWTMTLCEPDGSGLCCIRKDDADPNPQYNRTTSNGCEHGDDCGEDPE